jgi:hypothetical protein
MKTQIRGPIIAILCAAAVGCGSTIRASGDALTDRDGPVDTSVTDTAVTDTAVADTSEDPVDDVPADTAPDSSDTQCSDGIDNDGDDLIDMEDFDCANPSDDVEGPEGGCTVDNHCAGGWNECDPDTHECYDPPEGALCDPCYRSEDCGDGVTGDDPDRDYCVIYGTSGRCSKDCRGDFDCPKGFYCDPDVTPPHPGMCLPTSGSCWNLDAFGNPCSRNEDCGWGDRVVCEGSICTSMCEVEHDCPMGWSCVSGMCVED